MAPAVQSEASTSTANGCTTSSNGHALVWPPSARTGGTTVGLRHPHPPPKRDTVYLRVVKPAFDSAAAAVLLVLLLPLLLTLALVVLLSMGRPVLYRQERVGRSGKHFRIWKFRTMQPDRRLTQVPVDVDRRVCHKRQDDPRHTPVGSVLRRLSLDELPQLLNVLCGQMSLVGPRPELPSIVARYEEWQHERHAVKPGLTGLWQVSKRGDGLMHQHTEIDLSYVRQVGPMTDLKLICRTVAILVARTGN